MGSLVWVGTLEASPYQHLLTADLWGQLRESLIVDGSRVSGLSRESILAVAFRVSRAEQRPAVVTEPHASGCAASDGH